MFSDAEKQELTALLEGLRSTGLPEETRCSKKVSALLGEPRQSWIEADFSLWSKTGDQPDLFGLLRHAILNRKRIEFDYYGLSQTATHRIVEPLRLVFKAQAWYCYAWCTPRRQRIAFSRSYGCGRQERNESFEPRLLVKRSRSRRRKMRPATITMKVQPQGNCAADG